MLMLLLPPLLLLLANSNSLRRQKENYWGMHQNIAAPADYDNYDAAAAVAAPAPAPAVDCDNDAAAAEKGRVSPDGALARHHQNQGHCQATSRAAAPPAPANESLHLLPPSLPT